MTLPLKESLQTAMDKIFPSNLPSPNLYRIIAKNEALFTELIESKIIGKTGLFDRKRITPMLREKIILRTCIMTKNYYEFALHLETISLKLGLSLDQIHDIKNQNCQPGLWEESDLAIFDLIQQLVHDHEVGDAVAKKVMTYFSEEEIIDIIQLVGLYTTVSMMVAFSKPALDNYQQYTHAK